MSSTTKPERVKDILPRLDGTDRRNLDRSHSLTTKEQEIDHFIAQANEARRDYEDAAKEYRELAYRESELEAGRHKVREGIKLRLMGSGEERPATALPAISATAAEKLSTCDEEYLDYLAVQRDTVRQKDDAFTRMHSADLRALTAIAACRAIGGWV